MENIDHRLQAGTQIEVVGSYLEPVVGALIDIKTTADLDFPTVVQTALPVVKSFVLIDTRDRGKPLSLIWESQWPIKPGLVFEGGNMAGSPGGGELSCLHSLQLLTTNWRIQSKPLTTTGDTNGETPWLPGWLLLSWLTIRISGLRRSEP